MPIKRCTLNGSAIRSLDDLYDQLIEKLSFPDYFGRNLDALWDVLSHEVEGPFEIIWKHAAESKKAMGIDYERGLRVLRDLERERDDFTLKVEQ
jgi:ribonuclease inhibitor